MDKQLLLKNFIGQEEKLAFSKALDQAIFAIKKHEPAFTDFMDPIKAGKIAEVLKTCRELALTVDVYGGSPECERVRVGFFPEYQEAEPSRFPIDAIELLHKTTGLEHRDFLGSLIGLGVDRGRIGDIFVKEDRAIVFADRELASFICGNLTKIGRQSVEVRLLSPEDVFVYQIEKEEIVITVSSLRIDSILAAAFHLSRGKAAQLIAGEKAFVNWLTINSASKQVGEGDLITLRGYGRVKIKEIAGKTKKDKFVVKVSR